jgi:acetyl/propionyl-CoA carboxylase alpha subunit
VAELLEGATMNTSQLVQGTLWVHVNGRTFIYEGKKKKWGAKASKQAKPGILAAPMPGKVTKILKSLGESVAAGEVVLVMEAMKMEYTLKADVAGKIERLNCKVGEQVALGKVLAEIK